MASRTKAWEPNQRAAYTGRVCRLARQAVRQAKGPSKEFAVAAMTVPEHKRLQHMIGNAAVAQIVGSRAATVRFVSAVVWHTPEPSCPGAHPVKDVPWGS